MEMEQHAPIPSHVAIIMDGNGRCSPKAFSAAAFMGHRKGVAALKNAVRFCMDRGIATLTVYAFSTENWAWPERRSQLPHAAHH